LYLANTQNKSITAIIREITANIVKNPLAEESALRELAAFHFSFAVNDK
jgi:hypothetical protein